MKRNDTLERTSIGTGFDLKCGFLYLCRTMHVAKASTSR
uniref:Uncharacterized protein n=1 Tax=Arundo donax TaxID=35708 RepID=A0A0A9HNY3_ARUDO